MIIFDGDYERIFHQMVGEEKKVDYYLNKCSNGIVKRYRQTRTFPVWYSEAVTIPSSQNTYMFYYYAKNADELDRFNHFYGALLLLNENNGKRMVITLRSMTLRELVKGGYRDIDSMGMQVYSGHFFSRYRERMNLPSDLSANDVILTFFGRNGHYFSQLDYDKIVLEKNRHKGNSAFGIEDGIILSEEKDYGSFHLFKHNTFLSYSTLKQSQKDATPPISWMRDQVVRERRV